MKRVFLGLLLLINSGILFAQIPKLSLGSGPFFANYVSSGGFVDFDFLLFNKESWNIRNHFIFRGTSLSDDQAGIFSLSEKISGGYFMENKFHSYIYFEGGIGIWAKENKKYFEMPLAYTFGGGCGTDIFLTEIFCLHIEAGALIYLLENDWKIGGMFQTGWKWYYK